MGEPTNRHTAHPKWVEYSVSRSSPLEARQGRWERADLGNGIRSFTFRAGVIWIARGHLRGVGLRARGALLGAVVLLSALAAAWPADSGAGGGEAARSQTKLVSSSGRALPARWQRWVRRSLVPIVNGRVRVGLRGCPAHPSAVGCVYSDRLTVVYIDERRAVLPATLYHELGHLFDWRVLNNGDRRRFKRLVGKPRSSWFRGRNSPSEQFAEAYSFCARYKRIRSIRAYTTYGYDPSPAEHRAACRLIAAAAKPASTPSQPPPNPPATISDPEPPPQQPPPDETEPDEPSPCRHSRRCRQCRPFPSPSRPRPLPAVVSRPKI